MLSPVAANRFLPSLANRPGMVMVQRSTPVAASTDDSLSSPPTRKCRPPRSAAPAVHGLPADQMVRPVVTLTARDRRPSWLVASSLPLAKTDVLCQPVSRHNCLPSAGWYAVTVLC